LNLFGFFFIQRNQQGILPHDIEGAMMNISQARFIINKKRIKRRIKKKKRAEERCNHCHGAFKGSEELESCIMCGREKGHICRNCMHVPEDKTVQKSA
tara:strand:+ start:222 stop:515 length:294 start_codon:yes stop_codon:yes gene_type:complete